MPIIRVLILRAPGTNCDRETAHAWRSAGATPTTLPLQAYLESPRLEDYRILTIPGGFSYGDDISAGRIFASQLSRHVRDRLYDFVDRGGLVLGICNGFQVLVKLGLLPYPATADAPPMASITYNRPEGYQDRWVHLRAETDHCPFLERNRTYEMPMAHGEGRVVFDRPETANDVRSRNLAALTFVAGTPCTVADGPDTPNGSELNVAGLCDPTGRVLGLMPHPERFLAFTQHPCWTALSPRPHGDGFALFRRAVEQLS